MNVSKLMALGMAAMTLTGAAFAQEPMKPMKPMMMTKADKKMMTSCMAMTHDAMMADTKCQGMMTKMKMTDADMTKMMSCKKMDSAMMMKDKDCMMMSNMHPDMMKMMPSK